MKTKLNEKCKKLAIYSENEQKIIIIILQFKMHLALG